MRASGQLFIPLAVFAVATLLGNGYDYDAFSESANEVEPHVRVCRTVRRLRREISNITIKNCPSTQGTQTLSLSNLTYSPSPIVAPGDVLLNFALNVSKPLPAFAEINVEMYKYMFGIPFWMPCIQIAQSGLLLGSCSYKQVCERIHTWGCSALSRNNIPCSCAGIRPGRYEFKNPLAFTIPSISEVFDVLVQGNFKMKAEFTDSTTKTVFGCVEATWTISKTHRPKLIRARNWQ